MLDSIENILKKFKFCFKTALKPVFFKEFKYITTKLIPEDHDKPTREK